MPGPVELYSTMHDFTGLFVFRKREAILHLWLAEQTAASLADSAVGEPLPSLAAEFLEHFLEGLKIGDGLQGARHWVNRAAAGQLSGQPWFTPTSLASFFLSLRRALTSTWTEQARNGRRGTGTRAEELLAVLAYLDDLLLEGLVLLQEGLADQELACDSQELVLRPINPELDSLDLLDSVEIAPPRAPAFGLRNVARLLR